MTLGEFVAKAHKAGFTDFAELKLIVEDTSDMASSGKVVSLKAEDVQCDEDFFSGQMICIDTRTC